MDTIPKCDNCGIDEVCTIQYIILASNEDAVRNRITSFSDSSSTLVLDYLPLKERLMASR